MIIGRTPNGYGMEIAFFDFDNTLTVKDSLGDFIEFAVGRRSFYVGLLLLSPWLAAYKTGLAPNHVTKQKLFAFFFKGWSIKRFSAIAREYSLEKIDAIMRPAAMEKLGWHQSRGHTVVVVSASMENWLQPWCDKYGVGLIATGLEVKDGQLTGKFSTPNCHGMEKVNRINARYTLSDYDVIYAYGDSSGDREMLALAHRPFYQRFT